MQLIVCTFDAAARAEEVKEAIQALDSQVDTIKLGNIAIVQKTADGQVSFRETADPRNELGQIAGTVVGGITWFIYAFAGSFGPMASSVAEVHTESAVHRLVGDMGFPDTSLQQIGEHLDARSSALITLVRPEERPIVVAELERLGGTIVEHTLPPAVVAELKQAA